MLHKLYLAELPKQDTGLRFGYADDIGLYRAAWLLEENVELLAQDVRRVLQWADDNKVSFAPERWEMTHITRKRNRGPPTPPPPPPVVVNEHFSTQPVPKPERNTKNQHSNGLGVWLDRKLILKRHRAERAGKAMAPAQHIHSLDNCKHGPPASSLRKTVIISIIPMALYGVKA